ncbi:MAG: hypothetical protein KGJ79_05600 [Alphaproteobacteria bacterium]|nr:hypothetical protein [Alphaproteobacteria bacterium]MDE2110596.1 hypothetical protein [Alphaproteobacteria bacterium]MDE2495025.1 hypothetical protein [Alphaproteobacteria bacterium]
MKGKSALMAGVAAVALIATAQAGFAGKARSDEMSNSSAMPAGVSQEQYDQLSQRVDALEAELQQSEIREAADHDKVESWKSVSGWWDNTSISGRMYWDITNLDLKNNGTASKNNGTSFDIKRFYVGIDHKFNDTFSANVTTDVTYDSNISVSQVYIKKAYLQAKLDPAFTVRVGSADMPWIPYAEGVYGYRFVENTLIDRTKFGASADWGVYLLGDLADGLVSYEFSATTGAGYKKIVRSNSPDFEGRVSFKYEGLQLAVGGYAGKLGTTHGTSRKTATRFDAIGAYTFEGLKVGVEYFTASDWAYAPGMSSVTDTTHGDGYSPFASYQFDPEWSVFGRYDYVKPYSDTMHKMYHNTYYNIGIDYRPTKIVDIALVYKHDAGSNGYFGDSNGTIGGTAFAMGNNGTDNEIGLWGDFQW